MLSRNAVASCSTSTLSSPAKTLRTRALSSKNSRPAALQLNSPLLHQVIDALKAGAVQPTPTPSSSSLSQAERDEVQPRRFGEMYAQHGWARTKSQRNAVRLDTERVEVHTRYRERAAKLSRERSAARVRRRGFASSATRMLQPDQEPENDAVLSELLPSKEETVSPGTIRLGTMVEARPHASEICVGVIVHIHSDGLISLLSHLSLSEITFQSITYVFPSPPLSAAEAAAVFEAGFFSQLAHTEIQRLRQFHITREKETNFLISQGALDLHRALPPSQSTMTPEKGLARLGVARSPPRDYAMHLILMADPFHFVSDPARHSVTQTFAVRPPSDVERFDTVRGWYRAASPEMQGFVARAAAARKWSRTHPPKFDPTRDGSPARTWGGPNWASWTDADREILLFLRRALDSRRVIQAQPYMSIAPSIVKLVDAAMALLEDPPLPAFASEDGTAQELVKDTFGSPDVDASEVEVSRNRVLSLLSEVGAAAPWENWAAHEGDGVLARWYDDEPPPVTTPTTTIDLDPVDAIRKDFGTLPVYVIDDPGAQELDDGLSIEPASPTSAGEPTWWVHVHIADPTHVLRPSDPVALAASRRVEAVYLPEGTWPMLSDAFATENRLSLGARDKGQQRVLTFSSRVDGSGDILESTVAPGVVRNVLRLTYEAVDRVLGYVAAPVRKIYSEVSHHVSSTLADHRTPRELDNDALSTSPAAWEDIITLNRLAREILRRRAKDALFWHFPRPTAAVSPGFPHHFDLPPSPIFYADAPLVSLALPPPLGSPVMTPAAELVSEWMIVANRSAARFCVERDIPVAFRSQVAPGVPEELLMAALATRNPATGEAPGAELLKLGFVAPTAEVGLSPKPHYMMGIRGEFGYTKVTSPLRRFGDMLGHWQIKAALVPGTPQPFSRAAIEAAIDHETQILRQRSQMERHSGTFWASYVLARKLADPTADPATKDFLENLTGLALRSVSLVTSHAHWTQRVFIPELGLIARMDVGTKEEGLQAGEFGKVRLKKVEASDRSVLWVEPRR